MTAVRPATVSHIGRLSCFVRVSVLVLLSCCCFAQQLEPRAYSPSPIGTTFVVAGFARSSGGVTFDPTIPLTDVQSKLDSSFLGLGQTFGLFGRQSLITAALPYVWGSVAGQVEEQSASIARSGLAGAKVRFAFNIVGSPALTPREFATTPHRNFIHGTSLTVDTPTGQYNPAKLINIGTNRWAFHPENRFFATSKKDVFRFVHGGFILYDKSGVLPRTVNA